ncbi:hypothetical protein M427DRAFT_30294 [Gonapodya prolifera JEL478]|uniref:Uncharacterized protein n=1 Tax=Gonapodya prolifera (strain JEL478) TaxID=1344416 RepID=A0A139ALT3_GONPJ|nr:hypothetical protein M427DRAFT_30294 [Gonapodya prolifera JEL478]|eukprot:KXS17463.1 hypothetical protein M427DRAFT_30294 [Gonapodya prolifera JEL478]
MSSDTEDTPLSSQNPQPSGRNRQPRETPTISVPAPARTNVRPSTSTSLPPQTYNQALTPIQQQQQQTSMVAPGVNQGMPMADPATGPYQMQTPLQPIQPIHPAPRGKSNTLKLRLDINLDVDVQLKARVHGDITLSLLDIPQAPSFYVGQPGFVVNLRFRQVVKERDRAAVGN